MITMEMWGWPTGWPRARAIGKIRRMYLRDQLLLHEIAKRTGLSRNTLRRWLRTPKAAAPPTYQRAMGPSRLTGFHGALELAAKADAYRAKQNRRSAKAQFAQIQAEGYIGGYKQAVLGRKAVIRKCDHYSDGRCVRRALSHK